eukprot:tig00020939_g16058.t1
MAATEATLGEQIEARWGRFLDLLEPEAKEPGRHINAEAELIKAKDDSVFERLPQEYASAPRKEGPPAKEGKEKGEKAPKADRMALPGDGPRLPALVRGRAYVTKKLSLATPLDELKEEYEEIQRELSTRGDALFDGPDGAGVHAANANPEVMKEVTEAAASTAAEPKAVGGKFNGL